jgi:CubicO group peptidase (beta-lactamase class C family)
MTRHTYLSKGCLALVWLLCGTSLPTSAAESTYFPEPGNAWESRSAESLGFDERRLRSAVELAIESETDQPRDLALTIALSFSAEPFDAIIGPTRKRGPAAGMIIRHGYIAAEWGDTSRVDMTFSVSKSFLSSVAGIAHRDGLIPDLHEPAANLVAGPLFADEQNEAITWDHLLRQTSGWTGTLWDKPSWADRPVGDDPWVWPDADPGAPGTAWKYNDVRVNVLALALLELMRRPLPAVLKAEIMDPIGASSTWRWHGYENSWVVIDGQRLQSVSGGGHWGGGMFISARDMARLGYLFLNRGRWDGVPILPANWYALATTPTATNPGYGFMNWFLNTDRKFLPSAPETAVAHLGAGTNMVYVDPENDLIIVARWLGRGAMDPLVERVIGAIAD